MTDRDQYTPGPASGAEVRKDGEKWALILVRELRHPPKRVWQAAHVHEWAPFEADRKPGYGWKHCEAHHGGSARAARYRNDSDASRRSQDA